MRAVVVVSLVAIVMAGAAATHAQAPPATVSTSVDLGIEPVLQATPQWCWLAVGEMVFRNFGVPAVNPHYQCGIVGAMSLATNKQQCAQDCRRCNFGGGDATTVLGMLIDYPRRASILQSQPAPRVFATHANALTPTEVRRELDGGRPIVAGINPSGRPAIFGASAHTALIVGYVVEGDQLVLIVNDPFPFSPKTWPDPYLQNGARAVAAGRYAIAWSTYTGTMGWVESFLVRQDGTHTAPTLQCLASSLAGPQRCAAAGKAGDRCVCGGLAGVVVDNG